MSMDWTHMVGPRQYCYNCSSTLGVATALLYHVRIANCGSTKCPAWHGTTSSESMNPELNPTQFSQSPTTTTTTDTTTTITTTRVMFP